MHRGARGLRKERSDLSRRAHASPHPRARRRRQDAIRITVARTRPLWTLLAAIGAAFLASSTVYSLSAPIYSFIDFGAVQLALWQLPSAIAVVAGSLAGARLTRGEQGTNALLEAAGAYSLVAAIVLVFLALPSDPRLAPYSGVFAPAVIHIALVVGEATAAAAVLAFRSRGPMRPLAAAGAFAIVGLVSVMPDDFTTLVDK